MKDLFSQRVRGSAQRLLLLAMLLIVPGPRVEAKTAKMLDLADTMANNRILTKLAGMIQGSDLAAFLSSKGPFTFFAPTDAAFAKLSPDTLDLLLQPQNKERLQHILLFHVVNGQKLMAKDLTPLPSLLSCEGNPLALRTSKLGTQFVLKAKIIHADIRCANGVIHEIDTVLMPPESSLPPLSRTPPPAPTPTPAPATNTPPAVNAPVRPSTDTNVASMAPPTETNADPAIPVAPSAASETSPH